jgi:hypothetical protein
MEEKLFSTVFRIVKLKSPIKAQACLDCLSWFRLHVAWLIARQINPVHASQGPAPLPFSSGNTEQ